MMVVRANTMVYEAASPQLTQALLDLINKRITPVVQSRGSPGEGDLPQMGNVAGTMVGVGDAYYNGQRMSAGEALARAGLQPSSRRSPPTTPRWSAPTRSRPARLRCCARRGHARLGRAVVRDGPAGHELERHAHRDHRPGLPAVPVPEPRPPRARCGRSAAATCSTSTRTGSSRTRRACGRAASATARRGRRCSG